MDERELPSESEESDVDYVPSGEEGQLSEEDSDGDVEEPKEAGSEGEGTTTKPDKSRKRQKTKSKKSAKSRKRARVDSPEEAEEAPSVEENEETEEEKKKKADSIWAAFKMETSTSVKPSVKPSSSTVTSSEETKPEEVKNKLKTEPEKPITVTKIFEFAGEKVEVTQEVKPSVSKVIGVNPSTAKSTARGRAQSLGVLGRGGAGIPSRAGAGLAGILGNLGKKNKLSTLEKSKLDWEGFKKKEGIDEEIQTHNRGKHGYLEKQDFLQRADLRQFELEKKMRSTVKRCNR